MANVKNAVKNDSRCHDCKKELKVKDEKILGGVYLTYKSGLDEYAILKCNSCFEKNKALTGFQQCEVYSRIVGYLRPLQQWNPSKAEEYSERKEYKMNSGKKMVS